jgi:hypothetical protein
VAIVLALLDGPAVTRPMRLVLMIESDGDFGGGRHRDEVLSGRWRVSLAPVSRSGKLEKFFVYFWRGMLGGNF